MSARPTPARVREHIAYFLQEATMAYETDSVCDRLGMPPASEDAWAYPSKRVRVQSRLAGVGTAELFRIARAVVEEFGDEELEKLIAGDGFRGVDGELKNLIFAAVGPKPRIVLRDAISNVIEIVEGADRCLVYDRQLMPTGLTWGNLGAWWREHSQAVDDDDPAKALYRRLAQSLASAPEKLLFKNYCKRYGGEGGQQVPALVPQVYLHYDPYTKRELARFAGKELPRQRMDFLLLPTDRSRLIIEVDGRQHYSDEAGAAAPRRYAQMMSEDRTIRLDGYEVYRFGGAELVGEQGARLVEAFFDRLLARHDPSS